MDYPSSLNVSSRFHGTTFTVIMRPIHDDKVRQMQELRQRTFESELGWKIDSKYRRKMKVVDRVGIFSIAERRGRVVAAARATRFVDGAPNRDAFSAVIRGAPCRLSGEEVAEINGVFAVPRSRASRVGTSKKTIAELVVEDLQKVLCFVGIRVCVLSTTVPKPASFFRKLNYVQVHSGVFMPQFDRTFASFAWVAPGQDEELRSYFQLLDRRIHE